MRACGNGFKTAVIGPFTGQCVGLESDHYGPIKRPVHKPLIRALRLLQIVAPALRSLMIDWEAEQDQHDDDEWERHHTAVGAEAAIDTAGGLIEEAIVALDTATTDGLNELFPAVGLYPEDFERAQRLTAAFAEHADGADTGLHREAHLVETVIGLALHRLEDEIADADGASFWPEAREAHRASNRPQSIQPATDAA